MFGIIVVLTVIFVITVINDYFRYLGNIVTPKRSSLDPENVDKIVYLHENMSKVDIKYDYTLGQATNNPVQEPNPDDVVALD